MLGLYLDLDELMKRLKELVPNNVDDFFPEFSTKTQDSTISDYGAFAHMVSPYYNYSMYLCGIPKVRVEGTNEDWLNFESGLQRLGSLFIDTDQKMTTYFLNVSDTILKIRNETIDFSDMFRLEECGSGSQVEVAGWIQDFFIDIPRARYLENYCTCVSKIPYKNITLKKDFTLYTGLFGSNLDNDNYLIPEFSKKLYENE